MEELNIETMEEGGAYDKRRRYRQGKRGRAVGVAGIVEKAEDGATSVDVLRHECVCHAGIWCNCCM